MSTRLRLALLALSALVGLHAATAQRGFAPIKPGPPDPPSKTCGDNSCCPSNRICICGSCFPQNGPFPSCAAPGPGIVYSCCDDVGTRCNRCNAHCCLGDDVCSCKGTCISKFARGPACGPDDYDDFGYPFLNCCESSDTGPRCSGLPLQMQAVE